VASSSGRSLERLPSRSSGRPLERFPSRSSGFRLCFGQLFARALSVLPSSSGQMAVTRSGGPRALVGLARLPAHLVEDWNFPD
jgi:hypothetical protein